MDRRRFLKYAAATAVAGAATIGGVAYYGGQKKPPQGPTTISASTSETSAPYYPPTIMEVSYTPTRVINDKVYDIRLNFSVDNPSKSLTDLEVQLIPVDYPHLPEAAFPQEAPRTVHPPFQNVQREKLALQFMDLKGGREYVPKVLATDLVGNVTQAETRTSYVREFENVGDEHIIAHYYAWYGPWSYTMTGETLDTPLLGDYDSMDEHVIARHADWALGHRIGTFMIGWTPGHIHKSVVNFANSDVASGMRFCIESGFIWATESDPPDQQYDFDRKIVRDDFLNTMTVLSQTLVSNSRFMKIDGRPVVFLYTSVAWHGRVAETIKEGRDLARDITGLDMFLVAHINTYADEENHNRQVLSATDGLMDYAPLPFHLDKDMPLTAKVVTTHISPRMRYWQGIARKRSRLYIPTVILGFYKPYPRTGRVPMFHRTEEGFRAFLDEALKYSEKKFVHVTSWNEWFEGTQIEPATSYASRYLEIVNELHL